MNGDPAVSIQEADLLAYADGRLAPGTAHYHAVEEWLAARPQERARIDAYICQNTAIRSAYAAVLGEPVPQRLMPSNIAAASRHRGGRRVRLAAAAAVVLTLAAALAWLLPQEGDDTLETFAQRAELQLDPQRAAPALPVADVAAFGMDLPDLSHMGFRQAGAQRLQAKGEDLYEVWYEDDQGQRLRLFLAHEAQPPQSEMRRRVRDGRHLVYWRRGAQMYALTGDLPQIELDEVALEVLTAPEQGLTLAGSTASDEAAQEPVLMPPQEKSDAVLVPVSDNSL